MAGLFKRLKHNIRNTLDVYHKTAVDTENERNKIKVYSHSLYKIGCYFTVTNMMFGILPYSITKNKKYPIIHCSISIISLVFFILFYVDRYINYIRTCCYVDKSLSFFFGYCDDTDSVIYNEPVGYGLKTKCDKYTTEMFVYFYILIGSIVLLFVSTVYGYIISQGIFIKQYKQKMEQKKSLNKYTNQHDINPGVSLAQLTIDNKSNSSLYNQKTDIVDESVTRDVLSTLGRIDGIDVFMIQYMSVVDTFLPWYLRSYKHSWTFIFVYDVIAILTILFSIMLFDVLMVSSCNGDVLSDDHSLVTSFLVPTIIFWLIFSLMYVLIGITIHNERNYIYKNIF